jgi:hypothetical protein
MAEARYEIRIRGRVGKAVLESFDRLEADIEPVETILHGPVRDQAELHGLLHRMQRLGLELIEVRRLPDPRDDPEGMSPSS